MTSSDFSREEQARFPSFARLGIRRNRSIPHIQQTSTTDCGAACLAMVANYHGKKVGLREVRDQLAPGRDGLNAFALLQAGRALGLRGRGVKVSEIEDLAYLSKGAILHWRFNHFVVFDRLDKQGAIILDPALGRCVVSDTELNDNFTGVALTFEPAESFHDKTQSNDADNKLWRYYVKRILRSGLIGRIVVMSLLVQLLALAPPLLIAIVTDRVVPHGDVDLLATVGLGMLAMAIFHFISSLLRAHALVHLRTKLDAVFSLDFLDHLVHLPFTFFQQRSAGDLMMRMNTNQAVREILTSNVLSGMLDGTMALSYLALIFIFDLGMGALVLGLGMLHIVLFVATYHRNRRLMAHSLQAEAESQGYQVQMLSGMETLKASGTEQRAVERWSNLFTDVLNVALRQGRLDAWVQSLLDALRIASPLAVLSFGAYSVLSGDLSLGVMLALNALAMGFLQPLSTLIGNAFQLQRLGAYTDRLEDVLHTAREQETQGIAPGRLQGHIRVENLCFRYNPDSAQVLREVSFDIKPGGFVAIAGASGSGKSTLAKLLAGLYAPENGVVYYDDQDLRKLDLVKVRRQIGMVPQTPHLFSGSIRGNIALANPDLPLHRIVDAARRARVHGDIRAMPMGYDTLLSDDGQSLSGGQRQRVALARALVGDPRVLLLDEATSALDAITEAEVLSELEVMNVTRIVIAHRLSTVKNADLILVMHNGEVVEQGNYTELLAKDGWFKALVAGQRESRDGNENSSAVGAPVRA